MIKKPFFWLILVTICLTILISSQRTKIFSQILTEDQIQTCSYEVVKTYPHDPNAFTQGLIYADGEIYESTGLKGRSSLRRVELETGKVLQIKNLDDRYFAEGMTLWQDNLIQLTWLAKTGFVYDQTTFEQSRTFSYSTQGWGLTHDQQELIMSDGSDTLYFLNPETFELTKQIQVRDRDTPLDQLNELEYINGEILANVWMSDRIARISPQTGQVLGWIDLTGIINPPPTPARDAVLNGIAYNSEQDRLLVTGKLWPKLFEIKTLCQ